MIKLDKPGSTKVREVVAYHLLGLAEAADTIVAQMKVLDETIDSDLDVATDAMGRLDAEIYTHLSYHMKELRRPFSKLFRELSRELDQQEQ